MPGPLHGFRIIEIAGIGPGPYCGMLLADLGAEVVRVDRASAATGGSGSPADIASRGKRSVAVDLKSAAGVDVVLRLVERADALFEGFRPGVMERLGLGPDVCLARNAGLVYGRMTGWGQEGPLARVAGHDINYIALAGALFHMGRRGQPPTPPLNLVGDFGGGGLLLAYGMVCALLERSRSGRGQVVDAAMIDGAASLMGVFFGAHHSGFWTDERGANMLDSGAHFYDAYETADGRWISIGSIEGQFYALLLQQTGLTAEELPQWERERWPELKEKLAAVIRSRSRDEWCAVMEGTDVCFAPVLSMGEAPRHPHHAARGTFVDIGGVVQPAPAPRFSRTPAALSHPPAGAGQHTDEVLAAFGFGSDEIARLRDTQAIA
jgi:alpha-methylacyl-CoA racemase